MAALPVGAHNSDSLDIILCITAPHFSSYSTDGCCLLSKGGVSDEGERFADEKSPVNPPCIYTDNMLLYIQVPEKPDGPSAVKLQ